MHACSRTAAPSQCCPQRLSPLSNLPFPTRATIHRRNSRRRIRIRALPHAPPLRFRLLAPPLPFALSLNPSADPRDRTSWVRGDARARRDPVRGHFRNFECGRDLVFLEKGHYPMLIRIHIRALVSKKFKIKFRKILKKESAGTSKKMQADRVGALVLRLADHTLRAAHAAAGAVGAFIGRGEGRSRRNEKEKRYRKIRGALRRIWTRMSNGFIRGCAWRQGEVTGGREGTKSKGRR